MWSLNLFELALVGDWIKVPYPACVPLFFETPREQPSLPGALVAQGKHFTVRADTFSRKARGNAFHTSFFSTSEPNGFLTFRNAASIFASSAGVVLRQPSFRPRTLRTARNLLTADLMVPAGMRGRRMSFAISL